jgi:Domain of unknown function (DUF4062)
VFLSSTAQDLVAHRQVADDTILRLSQESIVMERFGPLSGEPVAECERKARESDVTICRRSSVDREEGAGRPRRSNSAGGPCARDGSG